MKYSLLSLIVIVLLFACEPAAPPVGVVQPTTCEKLKEVVADLDNELQNITGDTTTNESIRFDDFYTTTLALPGAKESYIGTDAFGRSYVAIVKEGATKEELLATYDEWVSMVENCLPEWEKEMEETNDLYQKNATFSNDDYSKLVYVDLLKLGEEEYLVEIVVNYF